jgi:hypothetical protein
LTLDRAIYQACFSYITNTGIRLVEDHYISLKRPFETCIGVFTTTTGLLRGHEVQEVRELGLSFLPEDFHPHWQWDRYTAPSEPILQPLRVISYTSSNRSRSTKRLPSSFEATEARQRFCTLCCQPGHTKASLQCPRNIQRVIQDHDPLHQPITSTLPPLCQLSPVL